MTTLLLNILLFLLRFAENPTLALQVLKSPEAKMDVARVLPPAIVLPVNVLPESSGLAVGGKGKLYSHNDSGGKPEIYEIDSLGNLTGKLIVPAAENKDWEDLAQDKEKQLLCIGDFGNNANKRKDLRIYIAEKTSGADSFKTSVINFKYPDQQSFPPPKDNRNFDCEAFFYLNDSLYLFSKNRFSGNGYTKCYRLPAQTGSYNAHLLDSFFLNNVVTAADISPGKTKIALLTYGAVYIFSHFRNNHFFSGNLLKINIPISQAEGIVFYDDNTIYYSAEEGFLYKINLDDLHFKKRTFREKYHRPEVKIVNKQQKGILKIKLKEKEFSTFSASLFSAENKEVKTEKDIACRKLKINIKNLPAGIYTLKISAPAFDNKEYIVRIR